MKDSTDYEKQIIEVLNKEVLTVEEIRQKTNIPDHILKLILNKVLNSGIIAGTKAKDAIQIEKDDSLMIIYIYDKKDF